MGFLKTKSKIILISLSVVLGLVLCLLLFLGLFVEKRNSAVNAEIKGKKVIYSISKQKIVSRPTIYELSSRKGKKKQEKKEKIVHKDDKAPKEQAVYKEEHEEEASSTHSDEMLVKEPDNRPIIALVMTNLGLSKSSTVRVFDLPPAVTFGFSSYSYNLSEYAIKAAKGGHQILMNIPMEPINYPADDPGPHALISDLTNEENIGRLKFILNLVKGVKGVYTTDDEKFTRSLSGVKSVFKVLKAKDNIFLYGLGAKSGTLSQVADESKFSVLISDLKIDKNISESAINDALYKLEDIAHKNGYAIGMASPYPVTIGIIEKWLESVDNKGIKLAPISDIYYLVEEKNKARFEKKQEKK